MRHLFLLCFLLVFSNPLISQEYADLEWQFVPNFGTPGKTNLIPHDYSLDGKDEVIYSCTDFSGSVIKVLDKVENEFIDVKVSKIFDWQIIWMDVYTTNELNGTHLYILTKVQWSSGFGFEFI